jgi:uncharacterized protein (TIGR02145 family)
VNATGTITVTTFTCGTNTISDINGNTYNTVSIGTQCWTKENLRVRKYNDGNSIQFDASGGEAGNGSGQTWTGLAYGAHTIYAHDSTSTPSNLTNYGYLYNWYAVKGIATTGQTSNYKNICPTGWHVPTDAEWHALVYFLDNSANASANGNASFTAGGKLKSRGATLWSSESAGTDNSTNFSGLPGGNRAGGGVFGAIRSTGSFWSATESTTSNAFLRNLNTNNIYQDRWTNGKFVGCSVRCLKD